MNEKNDIDFCFIEYNSDEYKEELELRNKVLRIPLEMSIYDDDLESEKNQWHLCAYKSGSMVGVLLLAPLNHSDIKMRQVAVEPTFQHQNIGRQMVQFAENFISEKDFKRIIVHARETALIFYLKLSYKKVSDVFLEINIPHYKLEKVL